MIARGACSLVAALFGAACATPIDDPNNAAPTAVAGGDRTAAPGEVLSFDGSASADVDGSIVTYAWTFGDGGTADGALATHAFARAGGYVTALSVTDDGGKTTKDEIVVTVEAAHPVARILVSPTLPSALSSVAFDGTTSSGPAPIASYAWTFGDGGTASGAQATHTYGAGGTFIVHLAVTDADGATAALDVPVLVSAADVAGVYDVSALPSSYSCGNYGAAFADAALTFTVDGANVSATGAGGRTYAGSLDGADVLLHGSAQLATGGGCGTAPVTTTIHATFDAGAMNGTATAYYDLGVGCQCTAAFSLAATRR